MLRFSLMLVFFMGLLGGFSSLVISTFSVKIPDKPVFNGAFTNLLEAEIEEQNPLLKSALNIKGITDYLLFRKPLNGAVIAANGTALFTSEEFVAGSNDCLKQNIGFIQDVYTEFENKNVRLVLALIPSKAMTYGSPVPHSIPKALEQFKSELSTREMVSLSLRKSDFLKHDTHWSPKGAESAAQQIAEFVGAKPHPTIVLEDAPLVLHKGDLMRYLPLAGAEAYLGFQKEKVYPKQALIKRDLLSTEPVSTLLVGTSYSAQQNWSFPDFLTYYLGQEISILAEEGDGPFAPMRTLLKTPERLKGISMVIWEIPSRYIGRFCEGA